MRSVTGITVMNNIKALCVVVLAVLPLLLVDAASAGQGNGKSHGSRNRAVLVVAGTPMNNVHGWGVQKWQAGQHLRVASSFSVSTVRDLYLYSYWLGLDGDYTLLARLYGPDGNLYQQRVVPVSTTTPVSATRLVPGVENPVQVQQTIPMGQMQVMTVQLPVAGTWVTQHHLLGTWRVELYLDNDSMPAVTGTFVLTE